MLNKHILEAINRGIRLALDDYEDNDEYTSKQDIVNSPDSKEEYNKWLEAKDNKIVKNLVDELIYMYKDISQFSNKGDLPKQYEQRTIEIFDELDKIYNKWGRFTYKRKINTIKSPKQSRMGAFVSDSGTLQNIMRYSASDHSGFVKNYNLNWVDVSDATSLAYLFRLCGKIEKLNISDWDVSHVTNMQEMFYGCTNLKSLDISNWDVSHVTSMRSMFEGSNFNSDISKWNITNVKHMGRMFKDSKFNQPLAAWDVSNVYDVSEMFDNSDFNQDISNWELPKGCTIDAMFGWEIPINYDEKTGHFDVRYIINKMFMPPKVRAQYTKAENRFK